MLITRLFIVVSRLFVHIETSYESIPRVRDESLKPISPVFALEFDLLLPVVSVFLLFSLLAQWSSSVFSQVETRDFQAISRTIKRIFKESHPLQLDWWPNGRRKPINLVHNCLFRNAGGVYINVRTYTLAGLNFLDPI